MDVKLFIAIGIAVIVVAGSLVLLIPHVVRQPKQKREIGSDETKVIFLS